MALNKIVIHWTAGTNQPNGTDYLHYHFLINGDGIVIKGKYEPSDNLNCTDGKYAAHCGGGNTGAIGVSLCGMLGFKNVNNVGKYPLTKTQCEAMFNFVAKLCKVHSIPITSQNVYTHYEFGLSHPKTTSAGKIDIIWLPYSNDEIKKTIKTNVVTNASYGDFIRSKIKWYYNKL